jgi:hypothetical protein
MRSSCRCQKWVVVVVLLAAAGAMAERGWVRKVAGNDWTWFEDYVYAWATYVVACEPGRTCQVGMGLSLWGEPRGEKIRFDGEREILVVGAGAIYIRAADGKGPVKAALAPKSAGLLSISWDF